MQLYANTSVYSHMNMYEKVDITLLKGIAKTYKMMTRTIQDEMKKRGMDVTREQGMLLKRLCMRDGVIQNDLAWITDRDKTSLARLLSKMEKNGLITRVTDKDDKRAKRVFVTSKGKDKSKTVNLILTELIHKFKSGINEEEIKTTLKTLYAIQSNLDNDFEI